MSDEDKKLPAWTVKLKNGATVTLVRDEAAERNVLFFNRDGHDTHIVLSDAALAAVVALGVTRAGVPVLADGPADG